MDYSSGYGSGDYSYTPSKPSTPSSSGPTTRPKLRPSSGGLGSPTTPKKTEEAKKPSIFERFTAAFTSSGGRTDTPTTRPDPMKLYDMPDMQEVKDYNQSTAVTDALYDAQGIINQAYTPQMRMETKPMTAEEIKKFAPVKELTERGITVEQLSSMDAPMQKATLESLGITNAQWVSSQGPRPMSLQEFDDITMDSVHYGRDTGVFDRISSQEPELNETITTPATPKAGYLPKTVDTGNGLMSSPRPKPRPEGSEPEVKAPAKGNTAFLEDYLDKVLVSEGLYQDDIEDTGNVVKKDGTILGTMRGITPKVYAKWVNKSVNDLTVEDMKSISEDTAREIYREEYWKKPKLDKLPENLQESVFDMYINAGGGAIRALQRAAGMPESEVDGSLGPKTLAAVEKAGLSANDYADARIAYYQEVVRKNPLKKKYLNGWIRRANKYRD